MIFELTNEQRKYLGLAQVKSSWEKVKYDETIYFYFDGDRLVKQIIVGEGQYREAEIDEMTTDNRTILLSKTTKGKPKKMNSAAALSAITPVGVYFSYSHDPHYNPAVYNEQTYYNHGSAHGYYNVAIGNIAVCHHCVGVCVSQRQHFGGKVCRISSRTSMRVALLRTFPILQPPGQTGNCPRLWQ